MELLKISDSALKVCLTREDMEFYDIEFDSLDYSNATTRRVIWSILDEARRTLGFEAVRENLYIRAFRCMSGGCELFVSRDGEAARSENKRLFRFDDVGTLTLACARLENCFYSGESRLFVGDDERFYLLLCDKGLSFLEEVATPLKAREEYLCEHARLVCENAVETMAKLK